MRLTEELQQAAAVNPEDKFELVFKNLLERLFVERMDQNEEIFVRFMNDDAFQKMATTLVPLKIAAGAFGDPQHLDDENWEWVNVSSRHRLRPGMFVAQVIGNSI